MRILYLAARFPYPPNRGDRLTGYHFIRTMSAKHRVALISFVDGTEPPEAAAELGRWCERVETVPLPRWRSWLQAWLGLPGRAPSQVSYYASRRMRDLVHSRIAGGDFDVIFVQLIRMAPFVAGSAHPLKVLFVGDSLAANLQRSRAFLPWWKRPGVDWEGTRVARYEVEATGSFRESWLLSESETRLMIERGATRVVTVRHGVDEGMFELQRQPVTSPIAVFLGNLSVPHNVDAARFAAAGIWPRVRAGRPDATLRIAGADAVPAVTALTACPGVEVAGFVPCLADVWREAGVMLAPLRFSTGIQNKVLEAMAAGVPVVASAGVVDAIGARDGEHVRVARSVDDFAAGVLEVFADPVAAHSRAAAAREHVRRNFRWTEAVDRLEMLAGSGSGVRA